MNRRKNGRLTKRSLAILLHAIHGIMRQGEESLSLLLCVGKSIAFEFFVSPDDVWVCRRRAMICHHRWEHKIRSGRADATSFYKVLHTASSCLNNHVHLLIARNLTEKKSTLIER